MSEKMRAKAKQQPQDEQVNEDATMSSRRQKELVWQKKREEINSWADNLGAPIDANIKEAVVALNLAGLSTSASCGGHLDKGLPAPWIRVAALGEPEQRFVGENEVFQRYADECGVSLEDVRRMTNIPESVYWQAVKEFVENEETEEYRRWFKETQKVREIAVSLIKEFYKNRKTSSNVRLVVSSCGEGGFEIHNGGRDFYPIPKNMKPEAIKQLGKRLEKYQKEINDFAEFIKKKYLSGELST